MRTWSLEGVKGQLADLELKPRSPGLVSGVIPWPVLSSTKAKGTQTVLVLRRPSWRLPPISYARSQPWGKQGRVPAAL